MKAPLWKLSLALALLLAQSPAALAEPAIAEPAQKKAPAQGEASVLAPPKVTCAAWAIADGKTGKLLWGGQETTVRAMASTTKIMTAWIVLTIAESEPKVLDEVVTVSTRAGKTGGSSAAVKPGEQLSVRDLLYGLMLPSGNDAAVALAEHFGQRFSAPKAGAGEAQGDKYSKSKAADPLALFTAEMNRRAAELGMTRTKYLDPHGNSRNSSCAIDLVKLTFEAMKNDRFRDYVKTKTHKCQIKTADGKERQAAWENSNQLLKEPGYDGVKTGTTGAAGACVVSRGRRGDDLLLIVVLGSTAKHLRYTDSRKLYEFAWKAREAQRANQPAGN